MILPYQKYLDIAISYYHILPYHIAAFILKQPQVIDAETWKPGNMK